MSLAAQKPVAFVATTSAAKARRFYRDKLGLRLVDEGPFALVFNAKGTMLRVQLVDKVVPAKYTVLGWEVKNIEKTIAQLKKARVKFNRYAGMGQDRLGIWTSPSSARIAWFTDPDGNTLSLTQFK